MKIQRQILRYEINGSIFIGTLHRPHGQAPHSRSHQVAVLMFNSGFVPRAGHASLNSRICDNFAGAGYLAFRFDFEGHGDSPGQLLDNLNGHASFVQQGGQAEQAKAIIEAVCRDFRLSRLILGGLCCAAINALYIADLLPGRVAALLLMEPEFFLTSTPRPSTAHLGRVGRILSRLKNEGTRWALMRVLGGASEFDLHHLPRLRRALFTWLNKKRSLPKNANRPLIAIWRKVNRRRVPTLVITAKDKLCDIFLRQINEVVLAGLDLDHLAYNPIPNTNHVFTTGEAHPHINWVVIAWQDQLDKALLAPRLATCSCAQSTAFWHLSQPS